jgi:tetratricopeptide (TPR) repeat protein
MWQAPTRADWVKPCLVPWQRNFEDAFAVAEETGKPILICVNMDGEIASEHYAGIRYRTPEIAALYEPYVTVIASVYRHTPRDFTADGKRIPCPRFGGVTCGEHIAIEPVLYEKYFEGQRVAPRHIMLELDKAEVFDVYYAFDTASVFQTLREGVANRELKPKRARGSDQTLDERLTSRDHADREMVEQAFLEGDETTQVKILNGALAAGEEVSGQILRLALLAPTKPGMGGTGVREIAWKALLEDPTLGRLPLLETALDLGLQDEDREALVDALDRLGDESIRAKNLATVQRGLMGQDDSLEVQDRIARLQEADRNVLLRENQELASQLEKRSKDWDGEVGDGSVELRLAESFLARALEAKPEEKATRLLFLDARDLATKAQALGQSGWLAHAIMALTADRLRMSPEGDRSLELAVETMPVHAMGRATLETLRLYVRKTRWRIIRSMRVQETWSAEQLSKAQAAFAVLEHHPLCPENEFGTHYDFLVYVGARFEASQVLQRGLTAFPNSGGLHSRLRQQISQRGGGGILDGLEETYRTMLAQPDAAPNLTWFAGYATIVAAEYHRRASEMELAKAAYGRALNLFQKNIDVVPSNQDSAKHYMAIVRAALARLSMEAGDLQAAQVLMLESLKTAPLSASALDGLGITGVMTATTLTARLEEAGQEALAQELKTALEALTAETRRAPAFDRVR